MNDSMAKIVTKVAVNLTLVNLSNCQLKSDHVDWSTKMFRPDNKHT